MKHVIQDVSRLLLLSAAALLLFCHPLGGVMLYILISISEHLLIMVFIAIFYFKVGIAVGGWWGGIGGIEA